MKLVIYGAGAIGSWFGAMLETGGHTVMIVGRPDHVEAINRNGLLVEDSVKQTAQTVHFAEAAATQLPPGQDLDVILVTSKAYDLASILPELKPFVRTTPVCLLQNGIGNEEVVRQHAPGVMIIRGLTSNGVTFRGPGHVVHTGIGTTFFGFSPPPSGASEIQVREGANLARQLAKTTSEAGILATFEESIEVRVWEKVFVNVGINAFGAIAGVPNGHLLNRPIMWEVMRGAVQESMAVARQKGVALAGTDPIKTMLDVVEKTRDNRNSMLQDLEKGKQTEIMFINGKIAEWGKELGIPTPINKTVTAFVQYLEQGTQ